VRMGLSDRGKRGGARIIYYFLIRKDVILLIDLYVKNEKSDLSEREKKDLSPFIKGTHS